MCQGARAASASKQTAAGEVTAVSRAAPGTALGLRRRPQHRGGRGRGSRPCEPSPRRTSARVQTSAPRGCGLAFQPRVVLREPGRASGGKVAWPCPGSWSLAPAPGPRSPAPRIHTRKTRHVCPRRHTRAGRRTKIRKWPVYLGLETHTPQHTRCRFPVSFAHSNPQSRSKNRRWLTPGMSKA